MKVVVIKACDDREFGYICDHQASAAQAHHTTGFSFRRTRLTCTVEQAHILRWQQAMTGLIVEHWVFSAREAPPNRSGHTPDRRADRGQTLGGHGEEQVDRSGLLPDNSRRRGSWQDPELLFRRSLHPSRTRRPRWSRGIKRHLAELVEHRSIDEIKFVLGQGDFVFIAAKDRMSSPQASTSTSTGLKTRRSLSAGDFPKKCRPKRNGRTTTACSSVEHALTGQFRIAESRSPELYDPIGTARS
jgi:hypothetical protein